MIRLILAALAAATLTLVVAATAAGHIEGSLFRARAADVNPRSNTGSLYYGRIWHVPRQKVSVKNRSYSAHYVTCVVRERAVEAIDRHHFVLYTNGLDPSDPYYEEWWSDTSTGWTALWSRTWYKAVRFYVPGAHNAWAWIGGVAVLVKVPGKGVGYIPRWSYRHRTGDYRELVNDPGADGNPPRTYYERSFMVFNPYGPHVTHCHY